MDNTLASINYTNAVTPTSNVSLTYDSIFPRKSTAQNGWGTYTYGYSSFNGPVLLSQTPTTNDYVNLGISNSAIPGGEYNFQYQVLSSDTSLSILATSIKNAINANSTLSTAGVSATASGAMVTVSGTGTTTVAPSTNGVLTETLGGSIQSGDVVSITVIDNGIGGGSQTFSHTVSGGDSLNSIASGLASSITTALTSNGITATSSGSAVLITSTSPNKTTCTQTTTNSIYYDTPQITIAQSGGPAENAASTILATGGNRLISVSNNVISNSDITFTFDALGRMTNRSVNGGSNSDSLTYDAISRVTAETNVLGTWGYNYVNNVSGSSKGDPRLASINYPNSQVTNFSYYGNTGDQRLQQISNLNPSSAVLSQFNYQYNPAGEITLWNQQQNGNSEYHNLCYDLAGQLSSDQAGSGSPQAPFGKQFFYNYDLAANRTSVQQSLVQTARIGGSKTTGDTITVTVNDSGLSGGTEAITYMVQSGDNLNSITAGVSRRHHC